MTVTPSKRLNRTTPYFFTTLGQRIADLRAQGCDVVRMDMGSPDAPPAPHIVATLAKWAARHDAHGYQPHAGPPGLREAWAAHYRRDHQVALDPASQVLPLLGSKEGIFHLSQALLDPGDVVLVPDPGYLTYAQAALFAGAEPHYLSLRPDNAFLPDLDFLPPGVLARAKLLWLNYPNNPTAAVAPPEFFIHALAFCNRHGLLLAHDAAYTRVTFDGYRASSVLEFPGAAEVAVEFNTLSKLYNMAGWRVGAAVGNPAALRLLHNVKSHADSGHFLPVHQAAIAALTGDQRWVEERNAVYARRRDRLLAALRALGLDVVSPQASLYVWAPVPSGSSSAAFAEYLLERAFISVVPGPVFGPAGEGFVRFSLTVPDDRLALAIERLQGTFD